MPIPTYPFDSTGVLASNRILNESHAVTIANGINAFLIVPNATPFYGNSLTVVNSNGQTLQEGVDYFLTHPWAQATEHTGIPVFGTITLLAGYPIDTYKINYQTIGGEYVDNPANVIAEGIIATNGEYLEIDWSTAPTAFPASPHSEPLNGLDGTHTLIRGLYQISEALLQPKAGVHYDDVADMDNMYAASVAKPLMEVIAAIEHKDRENAKMWVSLLETITPIKNQEALPPDLQHCALELPGGFRLKMGRIYFDVTQEPTVIDLLGPDFTHVCLFATASMGFLNPATPVNKDQVFTGDPTLTTIPIKIVYDPVAAAGTRVLKYLAIGK